MNRWTHIIPRMFIFGLITLAVWLGRDPLIRYVIIAQAQQLTGAKVEIGQLRSTLDQGKLYLNNLKITDPRDPMRNFLQADIAHLKFDLQHLWRREFVIEEGRTCRLVFGAPRTESGAFTTSNQDSTKSKSSNIEPSRDNSKVSQIGQRWLDQLHFDSEPTDFTAFKVEQLLESPRPDWQQKIKGQGNRVTTLNPAIENLKISLATEFKNPLRDLSRFEHAAKELERLLQESNELQTELNTQLDQIEQTKQNLMAANKLDQQKLNQQPNPNQVDNNLVSQLLLHQHQQTMVNEVVDWFRWFRESIPNPSDLRAAQKESMVRLHGVDIIFPSAKPRPEFLIKRMALEGEGRFANQHLNFVGTAFNVTTQPRHHDQPMTFELRAQGHQHMIVTGEIDRRSEMPADTLHVQCPDLELPAQPLGHPASLLVSLGPASRIKADIKLQMNGDELTGILNFQHSNVALHVDRLNELAGGTETALRINQDLLKINQFQSSVTVTGTLENFSFESESDLGEQFTAVVARAAISHRQNQTEKQRLRLNRIVMNEIRNLDENVKPEILELVNQLQQNVNRIAELKDTINAAENQPWRKIR